MKTIEQRGKSVEDAVAQACAQLGVTRDQVEVEVLEEQKGGLFGLLSPPSATVRVTVKEEPLQEGGVPAASEVAPSQEPQPPAAEAPAIPPPTAEEARALVQSILDAMKISATATVLSLTEAAEAGRRQVLIDLVGDDSGVLIGKYGQTLYALQYLVNIILNKGNPDPLKVWLDVQGYRERREESLKTVARNAAARAKRQGRKVKLEPLPIHERRIIHLTLQDDKSVFTYSEGEDPNRYVIVAPSEERGAGKPERGRGGYGDRGERGGRGRYTDRGERSGRGGYGGRSSERRFAPRHTSEWDEAWAKLESEMKPKESGEEQA
jgi:spoIIIJ-associated protein